MNGQRRKKTDGYLEIVAKRKKELFTCITYSSYYRWQNLPATKQINENCENPLCFQNENQNRRKTKKRHNLSIYEYGCKFILIYLKCSGLFFSLSPSRLLVCSDVWVFQPLPIWQMTNQKIR